MTVRTRYAPSPTGYLHVGGLRTALYNYLFARRQGGQIILRIEDTDQTRRVEGAVENLIEIFGWLGLEFDEGPHVGGNCGPYVQSERLSLYRQHIEILAQAGHAYPCFCLKEVLDQMRADQAARGLPPMYDRRCRRMNREQSRARVDAGEPHVWRMAVPESGDVRIQDSIRGDVKFENTTIDDQVLLKTDGFPTYHMANVVDDHHMGITHVIRGEEWLPSTPKHVLLYDFFGWQAPQFAHLPLLLNPDRSKMSKRSGDVAVEAYKDKGILPEALINYVALLGWHPSDDREIFSLEELVREFSLERVGKAGAIFDMTKLWWMNAEYIKKQVADDLFEHIRPLLGEIPGQTEQRLRYAGEVQRGGADSYAHLAETLRGIFADHTEVAAEMLPLIQAEAGCVFIRSLRQKLADLDPAIWDDFAELELQFKQKANDSGKECGLKGKDLWMTIRAGLTGQPHGPELGKLVGMWGRERVLQQLSNALSVAEPQKIKSL
jgi:nondiscriminating glutamyl-tRNA synthetase